MALEFNEHHLKELTEATSRSKSNVVRLNKAESDIKALKEENRTLYEMSASIKTLTDGVVSIKEDVKEIRSEQGEMKSEIRDIKNNPFKEKAKVYDRVISAVLGAVGSGILMYILTQVAPGIFH